jgi:hypothetical protein
LEPYSLSEDEPNLFCCSLKIIMEQSFHKSTHLGNKNFRISHKHFEISSLRD